MVAGSCTPFRYLFDLMFTTLNEKDKEQADARRNIDRIRVTGEKYLDLLLACSFLLEQIARKVIFAGSNMASWYPKSLRKSTDRMIIKFDISYWLIPCFCSMFQ